MRTGWLAAAVLVIISAATFDLQMLERVGQEQVQTGQVTGPMGAATAKPGEHQPRSAEVASRLDTHPLQAGLQSYPDNLLADTAAACALDAPQVSEATLARCFQARLEASTDKDFRVWESLSRRLSRSSGEQLAEAAPMAARVTGQALGQG